MSIVIKEIEQENLLEKVREDLREQLENLSLTDKISLVNEINKYDGTLDYLVAYENDEEFFQTFFSHNVMEVVRAVYYGDYRYTDDYVRFNVNGNLESFSSYEFESDFYDEIDVIIDWILDNGDDIKHYIDTELLDEFLENK